MQKLILFACCFLMLACSVQKRRYQKGFYVSHSGKKSKIKNTAIYPINQIGSGEAKFFDDDNVKSSQSPTLKTTGDAKVLKALPNDTCDTMIFKDGSEISGKIIEVSPGLIKYKRCDLLSGPLYTVKKADVFMIKYSNGVREVFKEEALPPQVTNTVQIPNNYQIPSKNINKPNPENLKTHPNAIWSFVWGLLSVLAFFILGTAISGTGWFLLFSITSAIRAISTSIKGIRQINNYPAEFKGKGLAMTGRVLGIVMLSLYLLIIIAVLSTI